MASTIIIPGADFSANKLATVSFDSVPCTALSLSSSTLSFTAIGNTSTLTATPTPSNTTDVISWSSSNTSVATVADGVVTTVGLGAATITASCGEQTATCAVTVNNVVPNYVAICGYDPIRRSASSPAATTSKKTSETSNKYIVAKDQATGLYPIESKSDVDTSPNRFVPIIIPAGATKIKVTSEIGKFYTRTLWFDSTQKETAYNVGAKCVEGVTSGYDQETSIAGPFEKVIPTNITGLDSFCMSFITGGGVANGTTGQNYATGILIEFLYE